MLRLFAFHFFFFAVLPSFGQLIITGGLPGAIEPTKFRYTIDTLNINGDSVFTCVKKFENDTLVHQEEQVFVWNDTSKVRWLEESYPHGASMEWYLNGKQRCEGQLAYGIKVGLWKYWDEDGVLTMDIDATARIRRGTGKVLYYIDGVPVLYRIEED